MGYEAGMLGRAASDVSGLAVSFDEIAKALASMSDESVLRLMGSRVISVELTSPLDGRRFGRCHLFNMRISRASVRRASCWVPKAIAMRLFSPALYQRLSENANAARFGTKLWSSSSRVRIVIVSMFS